MWTQKYLGIPLFFISPYCSSLRLLPSTKNLDPWQLLGTIYDFFLTKAQKLTNQLYFINRSFLTYQIWPKNALCPSGGTCKISWSANRRSECDKCFSVRFESGVARHIAGDCTLICSPQIVKRQRRAQWSLIIRCVRAWWSSNSWKISLAVKTSFFMSLKTTKFFPPFIVRDH